MLFDILVDCSHQTVKGVFGDTEGLKGECFHEHTRCSSIGIYRCKRKNLDTMYNTDQSERRCEVMEDGSQKPFSLDHCDQRRASGCYW